MRTAAGLLALFAGTTGAAVAIYLLCAWLLLGLA